MYKVICVQPIDKIIRWQTRDDVKNAVMKYQAFAEHNGDILSRDNPFKNSLVVIDGDLCLAINHATTTNRAICRLLNIGRHLHCQFLIHHNGFHSIDKRIRRYSEIIDIEDL